VVTKVLRKSAERIWWFIACWCCYWFSVPDAAVANISECLNNGIPIISGTTGWLENYHEMVALCEKNKAAFIYGSNFSLGVNLFFELNERLSQLMANYQNYKVSMKFIILKIR
jgi:4-hydroxy-tetrahydrodipicolinate reductase